MEKTRHQWASKVCSWHRRVGAVLAGPTGDFSCLERQEIPPCASFTLIGAPFGYLPRLAQPRRHFSKPARWLVGQVGTAGAKVTLLPPVAPASACCGPPANLLSKGPWGREKTTLFSARIRLAREWTLDFLAGSDGA